MRYHCLIFFDPKAVFSGTGEANAMLESVGPTMKALYEQGHVVADYPLNLPSEATTVEARNGSLSTVDGPFIDYKEVLGGMVVIEARDLNQAVDIAARLPHAEFGHIEIRPEIDFSKPRPQF